MFEVVEEDYFGKGVVTLCVQLIWIPMLFIPLSFVVTILLVVLFALLTRNSEDSTGPGSARNKPFLMLILLAAFQAFLSGLRWGYEIEAVRFITPLCAALMPSLIYSGVSKLVRVDGFSRPVHLAMYAIPFAVILTLMVAWPAAIDFVLPLLFLSYAAAILRLMWAGPDVLQKAPFENAVPAHRALVFAALALVLSALLDLSVSLDIVWTYGEYTPALVTFGNLLALVLLSIPGFVVVQGRTSTEGGIGSQGGGERGTATGGTGPAFDETEDKQTLDIVSNLMTAKHLYRDPDLNLDRLARRALIPARQISTAINRATGKNVSQYVNEFRIAEACRLLAETSRPVTEIMFEAGFQTKSNFNREFRRVTDMTPLEWRQHQAAASPG